jgi:hypothetical protein
MKDPKLNKYLYKVFLICVKYTPITLAVIFIINLICAYCKVTIPILSYIGGVSFIFLGLLYLISFVFKFCHLYKIPLHYITLGNIIGICDNYGLININNLWMSRIYFIITGVALCVYIWVIYKNRNKPKIDHIKQLCDTYSDCNC